MMLLFICMHGSVINFKKNKAVVMDSLTYYFRISFNSSKLTFFCSPDAKSFRAN